MYARSSPLRMQRKNCLYGHVGTSNTDQGENSWEASFKQVFSLCVYLQASARFGNFHQNQIIKKSSFVRPFDVNGRFHVFVPTGCRWQGDGSSSLILYYRGTPRIGDWFGSVLSHICAVCSGQLEAAAPPLGHRDAVIVLESTGCRGGLSVARRGPRKNASRPPLCVPCRVATMACVVLWDFYNLPSQPLSLSRPLSLSLPLPLYLSRSSR